MRRNSLGIATYLIFAFGLAWTAWGIPLALGVVPQSPLFQVFVLAGAFAPALAAIVVRKPRAWPIPRSTICAAR